MTADELFRDHFVWAKKVATNFCKARKLPPHLIEQVTNAGVFGMWQAACRFDPARGCTFKTAAMGRMQGEMKDELRRQDFVSRRANRYRLHGETIPTQFHISSFAKDDTDARNPFGFVVDNRDRKASEQKEWLLSMLPDAKAREIVEMYYFSGYSQREIGEHFGVCESRANQLLKNALSEARQTARKRYPLHFKEGAEPMSDQSGGTAVLEPVVGKKKRYFATEKRAIVLRVQQHAKTVTVYEACRMEGVSYATYSNWKKKLGLEDPLPEAVTKITPAAPVEVKEPTLEDALAIIKKHADSYVIAFAKGDTVTATIHGTKNDYDTMQVMLAHRANRDFTK